MPFISTDAILHTVKNIALSGDEYIVPLEQLATWLADPACDIEVDRRCFGYAVRTDQWHCRDHSFGWHVLYLILEGIVPGRVEDEPFTLMPDSLFWLNETARMDMTWPARLVFTEVWFRLRRDGMPVRLPRPSVIANHAGELWPIMRQVEDEITLGGALSDDKLRYLLATLVIELHRLDVGSEDTRQLSPAQCRQLLRYVNERIDQRFALDELARVVDLSADYFSRCFRQTFSVPPREWVIRQRIREAARRLTTTNLTVYQVAEQLGYANVSQFSRQFHQHTGTSPKRYRKRHSA